MKDSLVNMSRLGFFIKRSFDIVASLCAILLLFPFFLVLTPIISAGMKGNPFFVQKRPGKNGKIFSLIKFRTMSNKKDSQGKLLPDEQRLSKFGNTLRRLSIDELPELFNILLGSMSFVGPRPQLIRDMVFFDEHTMKRQCVRPGLTGWAQINGRNNVTWEKKFALDQEYLDKMSVWFDLKILFLTVFKVFKKADINTEGMATAEDYGDYLLRTGAINEEIYSQKQREAQELLSK